MELHPHLIYPIFLKEILFSNPVYIYKAIYTANVIESMKMSIPNVTKTRGIF